jgi:hypothetical protein
VTFITVFLNGIIEGKLQWLSGLLSKFLEKSVLHPENTEGLAAPL